MTEAAASAPTPPQPAPPAGTGGAAPGLDPRIQPAKVGENEPPPAPASIERPRPPVHRIAAGPTPGGLVDEARFLKAREAIDRGLAYLRSVQHESGAWMAEATAAPTHQPDRPEPVSVAVTALGLKAFMQAMREGAPMDPAAERALAFVLQSRDRSAPLAGWGGGDGLGVYVTSCVVSGLASVRDPALEEELRDGVEILRASQWDEGEGLTVRQDWFGGAGYGRHGRPDLSNTQMMLEALHDAGVPHDDPAMQRAIAFVSRTQNLKAVNRAEWAAHGPDDGGFVYTPAGGGESFASEAVGEGRYGENLPQGAPRSLRSYGSMTYAGFKSLLYAGLSRDDVRVRAALEWIRRHFTFAENPGLGQQGLYYYLHAMARALAANGEPTIAPYVPAPSGPGDAPTLTAGAPHNWREEMIDAIVARQRPDGSWANAADRWLESKPELATIYSLLALEECLKPVEP